MKLREYLIPAIVGLLLVGILAPLCFAAGLDGHDPCCEKAAQVASMAWTKASPGFVAALGAVAVAFGGFLAVRRCTMTATPHTASSLVLSAVPLRI